MPLAPSQLLFAGRVFASRVVLAPINTGFASEGRPTAELLRFHRERSGSGIGLSVVGNVSVSMTGRSNSSTAVMRVDTIESFREVASAIRSRGSLAGIQLANSPARLSPARKWRHKNLPAEIYRLRRLVAEYSPANLLDELRDFISAARMSKASGFDLVQVHAAHGYLLSLLTSRYTNARQDYFAANGPWLEDFVAKLRQAVGTAFLSFRVSIHIGIDSAQSEEAAGIEICRRLTQNGVQVLDLTDGMYTVDRHLIYPVVSRERFVRMREFAGDVAERTRALVVFAAGVTTPELLLEPMPDNVLVALARPLIADPQFAEKLISGHPETIRLCSRSGHCHYFTRNRPHLECGSNPDAEQGG